MVAIEKALTNTEKTLLKSKCKTALEIAERIKNTDVWTPSLNSISLNVRSALYVDNQTPQCNPQSNKNLKVPQSTRQPTTREKLILLEGSRLNGFKFPPWQAPPNPIEFEPNEVGEPFMYVESLRFGHSTYLCLTKVEINLN